MLFKKNNTSSLVVHSYSEAYVALRKMGLNLRARKSISHAGNSCIVSKNGMIWLFSGDAEGFMMTRVIDAPETWSQDALYSWMNRKNFVVAVYDQQQNKFVLIRSVLSEGGVIIQNLARLVGHFDESIRDFLSVMKIDESRLNPLE